MSATHTYAVLDVSAAAYDEIRRKLEDANYQHAFHPDGGRILIDMHGIAIAKEVPAEGLTYAAEDGRDGWICETGQGRLYCRSRQHAEAELRLFRERTQREAAGLNEWWRNRRCDPDQA